MVKIDGMPFTMGNRMASEIERHRCAITDHVVKVNHGYMMDWDSSRIGVKDSDWRSRGIKESIIIR